MVYIGQYQVKQTEEDLNMIESDLKKAQIVLQITPEIFMNTSIRLHFLQLSHVMLILKRISDAQTSSVRSSCNSDGGDDVQKIVVRRILNRYDGNHLGEYLTAHAADGWRLKEISSPCYRAGGYGFSRRDDGFYYDYLFILLEKSELLYQYCVAAYNSFFQKSDTGDYLEEINEEIQKKNSEGYSLVTVHHITAIAAKGSSLIDGTALHLLVFERPAAVPELSKEEHDDENTL